MPQRQLDELGNPISFVDDRDFKNQLVDELRAIRFGIQMLLDEVRSEKTSFDDGAKPALGGVTAQRPSYMQPQTDLLELAQSYRADEDI